MQGEVSVLTNCILNFKVELLISFFPQLWRSPPRVEKLWSVVFGPRGLILPLWALGVSRIRGTYSPHPNPIFKSELVLLFYLVTIMSLVLTVLLSIFLTCNVLLSF